MNNSISQAQMRANSIATIVKGFRKGEIVEMLSILKLQLYLEFGCNACACTDGRKVVLPASLLEGDWDRTQILALLCHELGHVVFTRFDDYEILRKAFDRAQHLNLGEKVQEFFATNDSKRFTWGKKVLHRLSNAWEDARIDYLSYMIFQNGKNLITYSNEQIIRENLEKGCFDRQSLQQRPFYDTLGMYCLLGASIRLLADGNTKYQEQAYALVKQYVEDVLSQEDLNQISLMVERFEDRCRATRTPQSARGDAIADDMAVDTFLIYLKYMLEQDSQDQNSQGQSSEQGQNEEPNEGNSNNSNSGSNSSDNQTNSSENQSSGSQGQGTEQESKENSANGNSENSSSGNSSSDKEGQGQSDSGSSGSDISEGSGNASASNGVGTNSNTGNTGKAKSFEEDVAPISPKEQFVEREFERSRQENSEEIEVDFTDKFNNDQKSSMNMSGTSVLRKEQLTNLKLVEDALKEQLPYLMESSAKWYQDVQTLTKCWYKDVQKGTANILCSEKQWGNLISRAFNSNLASKLTKALKTQMLKTFNKTSKHGFKLSTKALPKIAMGQKVSKPFAKKGENEGLSTHVVFLTDCSGSMNDNVSKQGVKLTLSLLANCFSRVRNSRLNVSLYSFSDIVTLIKSVREPFNAETLSKMPDMDGGTLGYVALRAALSELATSKADRKVIICLTDGAFSDYQDFNLDVFKLYDIETYGIGYGFTEGYIKNNVGSYVPSFDTWISVTDLSSLPELIVELFNELIAKSQTR